MFDVGISIIVERKLSDIFGLICYLSNSRVPQKYDSRSFWVWLLNIPVGNLVFNLVDSEHCHMNGDKPGSCLVSKNIRRC